MSDPNTTTETDQPADGLAKRLFFITLVGVVAYVAIVILLMTSVD